MEHQNQLYTPKLLNSLLLNKTKEIANELGTINMIGDITECRMWKRSGMSFKVFNDKNTFECKVWEKDGLDINTIKNYENTNCKITGYIEADYYYSHKFILNVTKVVLQTNDSK